MQNNQNARNLISFEGEENSQANFASESQTQQTSAAGAGCSSSSMTPAQTQGFWDATFGFIGQELNALTYQQLMQNQAGAVTNQPQNLTVIIDPDSAKMYSVKDVAAAMGRDPQTVADDLDAEVNGTISFDQVKAYMAAKPGQPGALDSLLGIKPKIEIDKPAFDNYKIRMPQGPDLSLREIFAMQEIGGGNDKCLLDQSSIRGRTSYVSLLGDDLFVGFDYSSTTANKNQHLNSKNTFAALNLNGGSSIVIPRSYLDFASHVKQVLEIDTIFSIIQTGVAFQNKKAVDNLRLDLKEASEELASLKQVNLGTGTVPVTATTKKLDEATDAAATKYLSFFEDENIIRLCGATEGAGGKSIGFASPGCLNRMNRNFNILLGRVYSNFAMGMLWLGPGRFAFGAANGITFSSNDKKFADNYLQIYVSKPVGQEFRTATNWMMSGAVIDLLSDFMKTGVPRAVFRVGPMYLINIPDTASDSSSGENAQNSLTSLTTDVDRWNIYTNWKGKSTTTNFEDIKNRNDYARLSMYANNMTLGTTLERREEFAEYYELLLYAAPLLGWKFLKYPTDEEQLFVVLSKIAITDAYISHLVDPVTMDKNDICDDKEVQKWKNYYTFSTAAAQIQNLLLFPGPANFLSTGWGKLIKVVGDPESKGIVATAFKSSSRVGNSLWTASQIFSPGEVAKMWAASAGFQYVSNCKDTSYTILAYQPLEEKPKGGVSAIKDKLNSIGVGQLANNLSIGSALAGVGTNLDKESMNEVINMRAVLEDQQGLVTPSKLYYLHLDGGSQEWWGSFNQLEKGGCFRKCIDGNFSAICFTENGVELINKVTGEKTLLADKDHSLMSQFLPGVGATMVPNTLVSMQMNCAPGETILQARSDSRLYASGSCSSVQCLVAELSRLSGQGVGSDLSTVLGAVQTVYTDRGIATIEGGVVSFTRTTGTVTDGTFIGEKVNATEKIDGESESSTFAEKKSLVGTEVRSPSLDSQLSEKQASDLYSSSSISIHGDASVSMSGYVSAEDSDMGTLVSIVLERGKIEYDAAGNRLVVALYILGEVNAPESLKGISVSATSNIDGNGNEVSAIKINEVIPKAGQEEFAADFNAGLDQIQGDGGMQMFETNDTIYYFTTNDQGQEVLRILDKKTGEYTDYVITGDVTSDGENVFVPTDQGPFTFNLALDDNGQPTLSVTGPDGYRDIATLLAARGQNGIIIFDPATGTFRALNGQDISLNQDFARKGLTYVGSPEGVRGVPSDSMLDYRYRSTGDANSGLGPWAMPSFPENPLVALAMIATILGAVMAVRMRKR